MLEMQGRGSGRRLINRGMPASHMIAHLVPWFLLLI